MNIILRTIVFILSIWNFYVPFGKNISIFSIGITGPVLNEKTLIYIDKCKHRNKQSPIQNKNEIKEKKNKTSTASGLEPMILILKG